ncbi:hypothetical protein ITP53_42300 [Nonomuraea sp. K274]|uniref:Uncharacterized protein n=1 Tax=Nonomuraea cypriaca TaxID=1187855 RepID=A0A931F5J3_9ACTN|nr:hypothetical protein [Nonomuraea cypriaca]MBF8192203.1 hypothetical protein [Nonomuraea cypriaca]
MPHGDDLDARFDALVGQIDAEQRRRMRAAAKSGARAARRDPSDQRPSPVPGQDGPWAEPPRRGGRTWLAIAAITALIAAAGVAVTVRPDLLAGGGPVPEETMPVLAAPILAADPFAGSPAADYADGVKGFVMPEAKALGGLSKEDVAKGLERTRDLLAAAYLDEKTLLGGYPDAFVKALDQQQRGWFRDGLDDAEGPTRNLVNSLAPKTAELITDVIKVKGEVTLGTFEEDGWRGVEVTLNHLIVYALQRPGQPRTATRLVTHSSGRVHLYRDSDRLIVWVEELGASATPARCDVEDGFIHPYYEDSAPDEVVVSGPPSDPYVLEDEPGDGCEASQST